MKLDYKILWLDDKIEDFKDDEYIDEVVEHLKKEELNPIIKHLRNLIFSKSFLKIVLLFIRKYYLCN